MELDLEEILKNDIIDIWYAKDVCLLDYRDAIRKIDNTRRFDYFTNEIISSAEAIDRYGDKYDIITELL